MLKKISGSQEKALIVLPEHFSIRSSVSVFHFWRRIFNSRKK